MALLTEAVHAAGALALENFGGEVKTWKKADRTPVSEIDLAVNDVLKSHLQAARPDYGWVSEEEDDDGSRLSAARVWFADPIDGTRAFVTGRPFFSISVALIEGNAPVLGAIYAPALDEFYAAIAGGGATLNGSAITVSRQEKLEGARILAPRDMFAAKYWAEPWPEMTVETRNSIAYRLALVASGSFDAVISLSAKNDWDVAAGDLIVREAGGVVATHQGTPLRFNGPSLRGPSVIAANPRLFEEIHRRVRDL